MIIGVSIVAYFVLANLIFGYVCPPMIFIGFPCPGCGLTRAGVLLLTGNFSESFSMHPLLIPAVVFILAAGAFRLFLPQKMKFLNVPAAIILVAFFVLYIYRLVTMYPYYTPMVPNEDAILRFFLPPFGD